MSKEEIIKKLRERADIARKYKIRYLAVFGSYARGEEEEDSDIDLLVEFNEPTFRNYIGCLRECEALFNHKVDLVCRDSLKERIKADIIEEAEEIL